MPIRLRALSISPIFQRLAWSIMIMALVAWVASTRTAELSTNTQVVDLGAARALTQPALWLTESTSSVIWQPDSSSPGLALQSLDHTPPVTILPYTDVVPQHWQVAPAHDDTFHIVWQERDGRLRSALIQGDGQTVRGPIELSTVASSHFVIVPQADGAAIIIWTTDQTHQLVAARLDASGRPGPIQVSPSVQAYHLAAARDHQGTIFVVWLTSTEPRTWAIVLASLDTTLNVVAPTTTISTITLTAGEVVSTVQIGLTSAHIVTVVGITHAQQPDVERILLTSTSMNQPQPNALTELRLPAGCPNAGSVLNANTANITNAADLRWPRLVSEQKESLPLALACHGDDGWHPVIITVTNAIPTTFKKAVSAPLDAAPPAITATAEEQITLAWAGLDGTIPHLYAVTLDSTTPSNLAPHHPVGLTALLRGLVAGLALGWIWLILPTALLLRFEHTPWTWPMTIALFGAAQLLWPGPLLDSVPSELISIGLDRWSPGQVVGGTLLCIALIAGVLTIIPYQLKRPVGVQWLTFGLADILLVWAIFGSNVM